MTRLLIPAIALLLFLILFSSIFPISSWHPIFSKAAYNLSNVFALPGHRPDDKARLRQASYDLDLKNPALYRNTQQRASEASKDPTLSSEALQKRRESMGDFYVELPGNERRPKAERPAVKALYVSRLVLDKGFSRQEVNQFREYLKALRAGQQVDKPKASPLSQALALALETEINSFVIDVKDDIGTLSWASHNAGIRKIAPYQSDFDTWKTFFNLARENKIYMIARITAFKDPFLAHKFPEHAIQLKNGGPYKDGNGEAWVNAFDPFTWKYNVAVAEEAILRGFDEVQFDYVRFPDNAAYYNKVTVFPHRNNRSKAEAIEGFLNFAKEEMSDYGANIAADLFGIATASWDGQPEDIGQVWRKVTRHVDAVCPMLYPSHYSEGWYGFKDPVANPYGVIRGALLEAVELNASQASPGDICPWYQCFDSGHVEYGPDLVAQQVKAGRELGIDAYMLWNASSVYDPLTIFACENQPLISPDIPRLDSQGQEVDLLGHGAIETLMRWLEGFSQKKYRIPYLLTAVDGRESSYALYAQELEKIKFGLDAWELVEISEVAPNQYKAKLNVRWESQDYTYDIQEIDLNIIKEQHVFKIQPRRDYVTLALKARERALSQTATSS